MIFITDSTILMLQAYLADSTQNLDYIPTGSWSPVCHIQSTADHDSVACSLRSTQTSALHKLQYLAVVLITGKDLIAHPKLNKQIYPILMQTTVTSLLGSIHHHTCNIPTNHYYGGPAREVAALIFALDTRGIDPIVRGEIARLNRAQIKTNISRQIEVGKSCERHIDLANEIQSIEEQVVNLTYKITQVEEFDITSCSYGGRDARGKNPTSVEILSIHAIDHARRETNGYLHKREQPTAYASIYHGLQALANFLPKSYASQQKPQLRVNTPEPHHYTSMQNLTAQQQSNTKETELKRHSSMRHLGAQDHQTTKVKEQCQTYERKEATLQRQSSLKSLIPRRQQNTKEEELQHKRSASAIESQYRSRERQHSVERRSLQDQPKICSNTIGQEMSQEENIYQLREQTAEIIGTMKHLTVQLTQLCENMGKLNPNTQI